MTVVGFGDKSFSVRLSSEATEQRCWCSATTPTDEQLNRAEEYSIP